MIACSARQPEWPGDLASMWALADRSPLCLPHFADWPYRFASWALAEPGNAQVWLDEGGSVRGWAILQTPFWALDLAVDPQAPPGLLGAILSWATVRALAAQDTHLGRPMWFVSIDASLDAERRVLEAHGFVDQSGAGEDAWSKVLLEHTSDEPAGSSELPLGLTLRRLDVAHDIPAYVALHREVFGSPNMTLDWRERSTHMPGYDSGLDLVLASDAGDLVGFCVGWLRQLGSGERIGQIEPMGVHDKYRGRGLGRQLLVEVVHRLRERGTTRVVVETDQQRPAAIAAYQSVGFVIRHQVLVYRYDLPATPGDGVA